MLRGPTRVLSIIVCKFLIFAGKLFGKRSSATPGQIAMRIAPDILCHLASQVRRGIIVVCGTNGKTTTNNMIRTLLQAKGFKVVCNSVGANMLSGVVTAFADAARFNGNLDADYACIEADELWAVRIFEHFKPDLIVLTNLFRDQLDRYGEIDITIDGLSRAVAAAEGATLILNADDPLLASIGGKSAAKCVYYGVNSGPHDIIPDDSLAAGAGEGRFCRDCGAELEYEAYYYSHIGRYICSGCGFSRPSPECAAEQIDLSQGISFSVAGEHIDTNYRGFYNIYNILAAYAVMRQCKIDTAGLNEVFTGFKPQIGRMEAFTIEGKQVILNLSKNPAGFNQAISALLADKRAKAVLIAINDNEQDGRDISWLWDVDFERMIIIPSLVISGLRADDMLVRLKYAGFDMNKVRIEHSIKEALVSVLLTEDEVVYALVNYTALFDTYDLLKKMV